MIRTPPKYVNVHKHIGPSWGYVGAMALKLADVHTIQSSS